MIKWQYLIFTAVLGVLACQSAGDTKKNDAIEQQENIKTNATDTLHMMELLILPNSFDQNNAEKAGVYVIKNNQDEELIVSSAFKIEKLVNDNWQVVPLADKLVFEDITYTVHPKKSEEYPLALSRILKNGSEAKGKFRLVKEVWWYGKEDEKMFLKGEFEIK